MSFLREIPCILALAQREQLQKKVRYLNFTEIKPPARKRAFCFKNSYMTYVLNHYIAGNQTDNSILKDAKVLKEKTFEEIIEDIVYKYIGMSDKELCEKFGREYNNNKAQWNDLAFKILGTRDEHADEFEKTNIVVKNNSY